MKLLDKKSISQEKAKERKLEVEEGAKLARKVDALRETAAKEELNLAKFRIEYMKTIQAEMSELLGQRDALRSTVDALEERRKELLKPIDAEKKALSERKTELESLDIGVRQSLAFLASTEDRLHDKEKSLELLERRMNIVFEGIQDDKSVSEKERNEVHESLIRAKEKEHEMELKTDKKIQELLEREASIASKERENENRKHSLDARTTELNNRERLINDKYETLQRTIKRLK